MERKMSEDLLLVDLKTLIEQVEDKLKLARDCL